MRILFTKSAMLKKLLCTTFFYLMYNIKKCLKKHYNKEKWRVNKKKLIMNN